MSSKFINVSLYAHTFKEGLAHVGAATIPPIPDTENWARPAAIMWNNRCFIWDAGYACYIEGPLAHSVDSLTLREKEVNDPAQA